jgi:hypothetical protein
MVGVWEQKEASGHWDMITETKPSFIQWLHMYHSLYL